MHMWLLTGFQFASLESFKVSILKNWHRSVEQAAQNRFQVHLSEMLPIKLSHRVEPLDEESADIAEWMCDPFESEKRLDRARDQRAQVVATD